MAAEASSTREKKPHGFMTLLSSAASEWFLIFLLFMESALSYLLTRYAHYCELETPCLLCSRLDNCFWSLLCTHHRQEISTSVSCSAHSKFADIHSMCEECLIPIAAQNNKANPDSYKLLVGKLWVDVDRSVLQNLMLNKQIYRGSSDRRTCSCCGKMWRSKSNAERLLELSSSIGFGASKANVKPPLPRAPGRSRFSRRDSLKRLRDKFTGPMAHHSSSGNKDTLSHVGYTKLKISSDSDSEVPMSEEDDDAKSFAKSEYDVLFGRRSVPTPSNNNPSVLDHQPNLLDLSDKGKNLGEVVLEESCNNKTELISLYGDGPIETIVSDVCLPPHMSALSVLSELLSLCSVPPLSNDETVQKNINVGEEEREEDESLDKHIEADEGTLSNDVCFEQIKTCDSAQTDEYAKPLTHVSDSEVDSVSKNDKATTYEDSGTTPSQVVQLPVISVPLKKNETNYDSGTTAQVVQLPVISVPLKKNETNYDSSDGATLSDVEGENIVDRLKRQIEHDRTCMNSLYKDLEEERNASAIAANQAMAMITRLQEEKAALHMEALQYLRMMEEQAEYDLEALERANDLLADKEKELQDLEVEVEFYRNNFLDESEVVNNKISKSNGNCTPVNGLVLDFENEKIHILQCLRKLEKKLSNEESEDNNRRNKIVSLSNGTQTHDKENDTLSAVLEKEIAEVHDRLEALESDRSFLKYACELLRNGKDGFELVQEIARHLQEFRKMELTKR
ncbi:hypothetical protein ABFS82_04G038000 [Erythranthe guttata]|uniref:probable myosin-binding protein 4 n=1 Tax=Erythranthe guttata TaxID=4155 RepID=UPI00064E0021|nr:PREDICTED: probable myosin-binding protein 4 [Erythranthe guttata]|eukprot:XP_012831486.1 PREDICTED: probable myosin-binding protein 4 [Erythranthe guttata]